MAIQDTIHRLQAGRGKALIAGVAMLIILIAMGGWYVVLNFRGLDSVEAMDAAQIARQLATGKGFTTLYVRPLAIAEINAKRARDLAAGKASLPPVSAFNLPDVNNSPGYPAVLSALFRLSGTDYVYSPRDNIRYFPEFLMIGFGIFCFLATAGALYVLALRLFDRRVAFLSVIIYFLTNILWAQAISGLSSSFVTLLIMLYFLTVQEAMLRVEDRGLSAWFLLPLAGVFLGLAIVTRYSIAALLVPQALTLLLFFRKQAVPVILAVLVCAGIMAPWMIRNYNQTGTAFGANQRLFASESEADGSFREERVLVPKGDEPWAKMTMSKMYLGVQFHLNEFFQLSGSSAAVLLAFASLFHVFRRARAQALRWSLVLSFPFLIAGSVMLKAMPATVSDYNNVALLVPELLIFGCAFFYVMIDRLESDTRFLRVLLQIGLAIVCGLPFFMELYPRNRSPFHYPPYNPPLFTGVASFFKPNELLASDCAWGVAWYGNRTTIQLPDKVSSYVALHDHEIISGILIGPLSSDRSLMQIHRGPYMEWAPLLLRTGLPPKLPPMGAFQAFPPPPDDDFLIIADYARWVTGSNGQPPSPPGAGAANPPTEGAKPAAPAAPAVP